MNKKITANVGDGIFLVQGTNKWAVYDLYNAEIYIIDSGTAKYLITVNSQTWTKKDKINFIFKQSPETYEAIFKYNLEKNIFEIDNSVIPTKNVNLDLIWLEITEECNEKCIHCYADCGPGYKKSMPLEVIKDVLLQIKESGFKKCQIVGGEPFVHKNIWEIIYFAHSLKFSELEIFTNLIIPNFDDLKKLKSLNIKIASTLLGNESKVHDLCTRTTGSFNKLLNNLREIKKLEIDYKIGVIKMRQNESSMDKIKDLLLNEGLIDSEDEFNPDVIRQSGRGVNNNLLPKAPTTYEPYLTINPQYFHYSRIYHPCWRGELAISADGNVFPCVFTRKMSLGNIKSKRLSDIVFEQKETTWKINLDKIEKCKDCEFRYACMDCRALSIGNGLGLYGAPIRCNYDPYK